jgi:hypothetical protein
MEFDGGRALRLWGLIHQLRMEDGDYESADQVKSTRRARFEYRNQLLIRERNALVEAYEKRAQHGGLTDAAKERLKRIRADYERRLRSQKQVGFESTGGRTDMLPRKKNGCEQLNLESLVELVFLTVDNYLSRRPMQHALAWRVYVLGQGVRSFRYSENLHGESVTFCGSGTAAVRVHSNLKHRLCLHLE